MHIDNQFEGANPHDAADVRMLSAGLALIRPWSEDGDGNYKFCLNVKVVNDTATAAPLTLKIDWQDAEYMDCRDYVLVGRDDQWASIPGRVEGTVTTVDLTIGPGTWYVGLHPVYDLAMFGADRRRAVQAGLGERVIGQSGQGRPIVAFSIGQADRPAIFVVSRFHPYETAGSYCAAGIMDLLAADLAAGGPLTSAFRFALVPMANPDGVALGCPKRCRQGGPDICHEAADGADPAGSAIAALLAETNPRGYLDFHGWMYRDDDGLSYSQAEQCQAWQAVLAGEGGEKPGGGGRIQSNPAVLDSIGFQGDPGRETKRYGVFRFSSLPPPPGFSPSPSSALVLDKRWKGSFSDRPLNPADFRSRAHRLCNAFSLILSISWFGRTIPQVRTIGQKCLAAMCKVLEGA